jgi:hypothetical protein
VRCASCPLENREDCECLGESVTRLCQLAATRADYRREVVRLARRRNEKPSPGATATELDLLLREVARCPERGATLPVTQQPSCGCLEWTECRAGRGSRPGAVTLQDCLACVTFAKR